MSELEKRLQDLERAIYDSEKELKQTVSASMPKGDGNCYPYVYIIAVIIPIITIISLYFAKPRWIKRKEKGNYVICGRKILMWTSIISVIAWVGLYLINYCGAFAKLQACF